MKVVIKFEVDEVTGTFRRAGAPEVSATFNAAAEGVPEDRIHELVEVIDDACRKMTKRAAYVGPLC